MTQKLYNGWVVVERAPDVEGQWIAHCLDFDVVTQGNTVDHALDMIAEATMMVIVDDLQERRDPHSRRAPEKFWERMYAVLESSERTTRAEVTADAQLGILVAQFVLGVQVESKPAARPTDSRMPIVFEQKLAVG